MRTSLLIAVLLPVTSGIFAQSADSLFAVLDTARAEQKVKTYNELFRAFMPSDPVRALEFAREALSLAQEIGDVKGEAAANNNLGVAYRNHGALDKSLEYYLKALEGYNALENKDGIATLKNNISNLYSMKKDYPLAMQYLKESNDLLHEVNDSIKLIGSLNNMGNLHLELQLFDQAMHYYSESFSMSKEMGRPFADPVNNIGNIFVRQGNYQRAVAFYQEALEIEKAENDQIGILTTLTNLGIAFTKARQPDTALPYLREAETLCITLEAGSSMPAIQKHLAEVHYQKNEMRLAYETLIRYDSARERVYGEESSRKISQMEMVLDFQEKEQALETLKREDTIKTLQLRNSRMFIVTVVMVILVIIGFVNFYFMGNRRKLFKAVRN